MIDKWLNIPELDVTKVQKDMEIKVGEFNLSFYRTSHPVPGLAVKLTANSRSLFYTGDTSFNERLVKASERVNVLLAESTMSDAEQDYAAARGHMTTKDVAEWARQSEPDLLAATHFWDGYKRENVEKELISHCTTKFIMAYEGLKLTI
jgi:ribonuclease BN (tRNA processing enzyme)